MSAAPKLFLSLMTPGGSTLSRGSAAAAPLAVKPALAMTATPAPKWPVEEAATPDALARQAATMQQQLAARGLPISFEGAVRAILGDDNASPAPAPIGDNEPKDAASRAQFVRAMQADLAALAAPLDPAELNRQARAMQAEFAARGLPIDFATAVRSIVGEAE